MIMQVSGKFIMLNDLQESESAKLAGVSDASATTPPNLDEIRATNPAFRMEDAVRLEPQPAFEESQTLPEGIPGSTRVPREFGAGFIGEKIDQYTLIRLLGEGGMGSVYQAQQLEPVRRVVALKIIRKGMSSTLAVARFELERQVLAVMDHENIAKVFDGGTTPDGQPYFTMEFIRGVPITKYCDGMDLTLRARLELFVKVCRAVQHSHQRGVIHRDIKPANVLVTLKDDKPVPKVIDFGLARSTDQSPAESALTIDGSVIGTLEYMSPEQAELNALGVDTRTDVYSLGVLLYELITGTTPLAETRTKNTTFLELLRTIRERDLVVPSRQLSSSVETLPELAARRGTQPSKLTRQVAGELDWIATKALEKDRARRYATPYELSLDIERFLNDEPVDACPPSAWYRFKKTVRRNKIVFVASCVTAAALLIGLGAAFWQAQRAEAALRGLRDAAPHYFTESNQLAAGGKLEEARAKVEFALRLNPDNSNWVLYRAHVLEALGDYFGAIEGYHQVLTLNPKDEAAATNLKFCESLLKRSPNGKTVSAIDKELLRQFQAANLTSPSRMTEPLWGQFSRRAAMAEQFGTKLEMLYASVRKDGATDWDLIHDVTIIDGKLDLDFNYNESGRNKFRVKSIAFAEGLPIRKLKLSNSAVHNLNSLRGSDIESLELWASEIDDVSALTDCKLLRYLGIAETAVNNIKPLVGLQLEELRMRLADINDVEPLAACTSLQRIELPDSKVRGVDALRELPKLERIGYDCPGNQVRQTAAEFWREFYKRKKGSSGQSQQEGAK